MKKICIIGTTVILSCFFQGCVGSILASSECKTSMVRQGGGNQASCYDHNDHITTYTIPNESDYKKIQSQ